MGVGDDEVVAWCQEQGAVLVTADRGRANPEMIRLLRENRQAFVIIKPAECTAEELLVAILKQWDKIEAEHKRALKLRKQTNCVLNPHTGSLDRKRRDL